MSTVATQLNDLKNLIQTSMEGKVVELRHALNSIRVVDNTLSMNHAEAQQAVCSTFDALVQCIQKRRETVLDELSQVFNQKNQVLKTQVWYPIENFCNK